MTSDGVPCILAPLARNHPLFGPGPRGKLRQWRHELEQRDNFFSILLGAPDHASDDTLWLPQYLRARAATPDNCHHFLTVMSLILLAEVKQFGTKATGVAKEFAKLKLDTVERLLSNRQDLRSTLHQIAVGVLDAESVEPIRVLEGASRMTEVKPPRDGDDPVSLVRYRNNILRQFYIFVSIMLGDPQQDAEPSTTFWFPNALKKEEGCDILQLTMKLLRTPFYEVLKFGVRATDVAMAFARMDSVHVEKLLEERNLEDLQSTLRRFNTTARNRDTPELIQTFIPPSEAPSIADVVSILALSTKLLRRPLYEAMEFEFGSRAAAVAMVVGRMDSADVEKLLEGGNREDLRSALRKFNTTEGYQDTQILIESYIPPSEAGPSTASALPENTPLDDADIESTVLRYFGNV